MLSWIDGQIIVNKQKWVELQLQPFLTMARLTLKKENGIWWQKVQDFELNEYGNKPVVSKEGRAVPILFFIVAPITIITDKKVGRV